MNTLKGFSLPYQKYLRLPLVILSILSVVLSSTAILFAYYSKITIDYAIINHKDFPLYASILVGLLLLQLVGQMVNHYLKVYYQNKLYGAIQQDYFHLLLNGAYQQVKKTHSSSLTHLFKSDLSIVTEGLLDLIPKLIFYILRFLLAFVVLYLLSPIFALLFLGLGLILLGISRFLKKPLQKTHKKAIEAENIMYTEMTDSLSHLEVIKAFEGEDFTLNNLNENTNRLIKTRMSKTKISVASSFGLNLFFGFGYAFSIIFGAYQISLGLLSIGALTAIIQLVQNIQSPFSGLSNILPKYYQMIQSITHLSFIKDIQQEGSKKETDFEFERIVFKDLSFRYDEKWVLDKLDLEINKGDFVWIKGDSGLGKTTLFRLLLGFIRPYNGKIRFYGKDNHMNINETTRKYFSYVPQTPYILSDTIYRNLTLGKNIPIEEVKRVCRLCLIDEDINTKPQGYHTILTENAGLSIGQLQRLSIARAILRDSKILLLDEVTSALDPALEKAIIDNLHKLKDKTILFISHRPLSNYTKLIDLS